MEDLFLGLIRKKKLETHNILNEIAFAGGYEGMRGEGDPGKIPSVI